jgi:parvulin-like peptidyl-prolyl isomerase
MMSNKIRCAHILVEKHSQAINILEELNKGEKFSELAKQHSSCPSKKRGGDLGWFTRGQMVKEFENAAFSLEKNVVTKEPVKTQFGYHIIKRLE